MKFHQLRVGMFIRYEHRLLKVIDKQSNHVRVQDEQIRFTMYKHMTGWKNWEPDVSEQNKERIKKELGL